MQQKKKRQHHVWKHHLGAWATNGKVWCLQGGKIFRSSPGNLAVENEYYRLKQLEECDKQVVRMLCVKNRTEFYAQLAEDMIGFLDQPYVLLERLHILSPKAAKAVPMEAIEVNYVEDFYALIEAAMVPVLVKMRARDLSSTSCPDEARTLAFFLAAQYFRTKKAEERTLSVLDPQVKSTFDCDWDRVWRATRLILTCQVGASLFARLELAEWTILESPKSVELVTSDQPLFNTKAEILGDDGYPEKFALYFPICPDFAVLCDFDSAAPGERTQLMPEGNARHFNERIADEAYRQVFARRPDELEQLL